MFSISSFEMTSAAGSEREKEFWADPAAASIAYQSLAAMRLSTGRPTVNPPNPTSLQTTNEAEGGREWNAPTPRTIRMGFHHQREAMTFLSETGRDLDRR